jgi:hypothetical protein
LSKGDGGEYQVGGQVAEDHRSQERVAASEANGDLKRERLQKTDREEDDGERLRRGPVFAREQIGDERLRHKAAAEAVEREQRGHPQTSLRPLERRAPLLS